MKKKKKKKMWLRTSPTSLLVPGLHRHATALGNAFRRMRLQGERVTSTLFIVLND